MEEKLTAAKVGIAALLSAISAFLGWKGVLALAWLGAMVLDYISGSCAACKEGKWCSQVAREGLWHKAGMILAVLVAAIADAALSMICQRLPGMGITWPALVLPVVLAWYLLTELGSILENAARLGAPVPKWLAGLLQQTRDALESQEEENHCNSQQDMV